MKLKREFIFHQAGPEALLVPAGGAGFHGMMRGNRTLGAILELLQSDRTETEVISALKSRFDAPEEILKRDTGRVIAELRRIGALDESSCAEPTKIMRRRQP